MGNRLCSCPSSVQPPGGYPPDKLGKWDSTSGFPAPGASIVFTDVEEVKDQNEEDAARYAKLLSKHDEAWREDFKWSIPCSFEEGELLRPRDGSLMKRDMASLIDVDGNGRIDAGEVVGALFMVPPTRNDVEESAGLLLYPKNPSAMKDCSEAEANIRADLTNLRQHMDLVVSNVQKQSEQLYGNDALRTKQLVESVTEEIQQKVALLKKSVNGADDSIEAQIRQLERQKKQAIADEDFDAAKRLKKELQDLTAARRSRV